MGRCFVPQGVTDLFPASLFACFVPFLGLLVVLEETSAVGADLFHHFHHDLCLLLARWGGVVLVKVGRDEFAEAAIAWMVETDLVAATQHIHFRCFNGGFRHGESICNVVLVTRRRKEGVMCGADGSR